MTLLTVEKASLAFGHHPLLDLVDLTLNKGEVVALIGRNGTGKSSLLQVIAGLIPLDDGRLTRHNDICIAYVAQEPELAAGQTVFEAVAEGLGELKNLLMRYHQLILALPVAGTSSDAQLNEIAAVQQELEERNGWQFDSLIASTLSQLGLSANTPTDQLSGGWKKRVALARALVSHPDVLLLDEPTNHLDIAAIEWLEQLLLGFSGSILLVTHDRRLLDRVATRTIELDRGKLRNYPGCFAAYQAQKTQELANEQEQQRLFDKFHAQEEAWIRRGIEARRTRNMGRARRLEELRRQRAARRERLGQVNFQLSAGERSGKLVAELKHVSKSFSDNVVIHDFTTRLLRGDKVGLIGPNGIGKTTLLKLILGELMPDSGTVHHGSKLAIAYFDQFREQLDPAATVVDVISPGGEFLQIGAKTQHVMSYLEDFLFSPARARSPVRSLSGGERNRLLLARLFTQPANVLVLDEPTNDLDIETLELLEDLLARFAGTVLLISHDRAFLDNVVTQVIAFEGAGKLEESLGGYQDWQTRRLAMSQATQHHTAHTIPPKPHARSKGAKNKLSYHEIRELAALPDAIAKLEQEQQTLTEKLLNPNSFRTHPIEARAWQAQVDALEALLLEKLTRWEDLEARHEGG